MQEGPKLCPAGSMKPSGNGVGEHPLGTATPRARQDVVCSAAQGVLEINAEGCRQADTGLRAMQDKNTVTTSTTEPGGGSTSQADGKTGCGLVDV